jgi:hypothetical protein
MQEIRNLIMGMKPGLTPEKAFLHDLSRSARAQLKLRHKAIYLNQQNRTT